MVVAVLHPDRGGHARARHCFFQQMRFELFFQKPVCRALIDQKVGQARTVIDQRAGIVCAPCRAIRPERAPADGHSCWTG